MERNKKKKSQKKKKSKPLSLKGIPFEEAVSDFLKIQPPLKDDK